jgi:MFS transporter, DHA3 family, macrolide efflux protein
MKTDWKRNLALFMSSQTISLLGSSRVQYAMLRHITLQTRKRVEGDPYGQCSLRRIISSWKSRVSSTK